MVLSVMRRILYDTVSRRGVFGPEEECYGASTTGPGHRSYEPMMLLLESSEKNLRALFDDVRCKTLCVDDERRVAEGWPWSLDPCWIIHLIPQSGPGHTLVEQLGDFIGQLESKWGIAGIGE